MTRPEDWDAKHARAVQHLVERVGPLFANEDAAAIGIALADLTAVWLAGHVVEGDQAATDALRDELLLRFVEAVRGLTPINAQQMGIDIDPERHLQ